MIHIMLWIRYDTKYKVSMTTPVSMTILQFHCYSSTVSYYQVTCTGYDHFPESLRSCDWIYTIHRFWNNTIISLKIFEHSTEIIRKWKFQKCSWTYMQPSVISRDLFTNSFQYFKKNDPDIAYGCIKNWPLRLRLKT